VSRLHSSTLPQEPSWWSSARTADAPRGLRLSSVTHQVLHHAPCPVAVVGSSDDLDAKP